MYNRQARILESTFDTEYILENILDLFHKNGYTLDELHTGVFSSFVKWARTKRGLLGHASTTIPCKCTMREHGTRGCDLTLEYQGEDDVPSWWNRKYPETLRIAFDAPYEAPVKECTGLKVIFRKYATEAPKEKELTLGRAPTNLKNFITEANESFLVECNERAERFKAEEQAIRTEDQKWEKARSAIMDKYTEIKDKLAIIRRKWLSTAALTDLEKRIEVAQTNGSYNFHECWYKIENLSKELDVLALENDKGSSFRRKRSLMKYLLQKYSIG